MYVYRNNEARSRINKYVFEAINIYKYIFDCVRVPAYLRVGTQARGLLRARACL
jgi:hypothetical protein